VIRTADGARAAGYGSVVFEMDGKDARDAQYVNNELIVLCVVYLVLWLGWVTRLWRALLAWWVQRPPRGRGPDLIADARGYLDRS
jgi:hypothetical protein